MDQSESCNYKSVEKSLVDMAVESWRFSKVFETVVKKLDAGENTKYMGRYMWFQKKIGAALETAGMRIVNLEGQQYNTGDAVIPMNIDEFEPEDCLYVVQMLEPLIMQGDQIIKPGTVMLGRVENA